MPDLSNHGEMRPQKDYFCIEMKKRLCYNYSQSVFFQSVIFPVYLKIDLNACT